MSAWSRYKKRKAYEQQLKKYAHNSYPATFDWNWTTQRFNRIALVNLLVSKFPICNYLEIGCADDALFQSVFCSHKVGVDPKSGGTIRKTSDDFFLENKEKFDVVFIDGLHTYEQVRLDVINSIQHLSDGGWVAMHDMLPRNWLEQHIPHLGQGGWLGDVWKVAFELATSPDIDFRILKIDHGVGVFRLKRPNAKLNDRFHELPTKQFQFFYENFNQLPVYSWEDSRAWLGLNPAD